MTQPILPAGVSSGASDPIIGGGGTLVYPAIQSPNFSIANQTGWAILKNGEAYFYNITLPSNATIHITFSATEPSNPNTGDLWFDTANGNALYQWSGSAWVAYQFGTSAIADGAITASLVAANAIVAGAIAAGAIDGFTINGVTINGDTINATDLIVSGTDGGLFAYGTIAPTVRGTVLLPFQYYNDTDDTTSHAFTFTGASNAGDALFVSIAFFPGNGSISITSITDSAGNTYEQVQNFSDVLYQYVALDTTAVTKGSTITVHYGSTGGDGLGITIIVLDCANVAHASAVDITETGSGESTVSISTGTLSQAPELAIGTWTDFNTAYYYPGSGLSRVDNVFTQSNVYSGPGSQNEFACSLLVCAASPGVTAAITNTVEESGSGGNDFLGLVVTLKGTASGQALAAAFTGSAGDDPVLGDGVGPGLTLFNLGTPSAISNAVVPFANSESNLSFVNGLTGDGNTYDTGRLSLWLSANVTATSGGATVFTAALGVGTYRVHGWLLMTQGSTAAAQDIVVAFTGTLSSSGSRVMSVTSIEGASTETVSIVHANGTGTLNTAAYAASSVILMMIDGILVVSAAGTLTFQAKEGTSGDVFTVDYGSFMDIMPVSSGGT
jgi:hypothetical protein